MPKVTYKASNEHHDVVKRLMRRNDKEQLATALANVYGVEQVLPAEDETKEALSRITHPALWR